MLLFLTSFLLARAAGVALLSHTFHRNVRTKSKRNALCQCWRNEQLRKERIEPYVAHSLPPNMGPEAAYSELDRICHSTEAPPDDLGALQEMHRWIEHNIGPALYKNPLDAQYYEVQANRILAALPENSSFEPQDSVQVLDYGCGTGNALKALRKLKGLPREALHCIEVFNSGTSDDFTLHVLSDPVNDLVNLANGSLSARFDVISAFSVFHHIPNTTVRAAAFASIAHMLKPGGVFLLSDWNDESSALLAKWFDMAHWLSWLFMGASAPKTDAELEIGTLYGGLEGYELDLASRGLKPQRSAQGHAEGKVSPVGGFEALFRRPFTESESASSAVNGSEGANTKPWDLRSLLR